MQSLSSMTETARSTPLSCLSEGILARIVHYCGTVSLHELILCGNRLLTHKLGCVHGVPYYCNQNEYGTSILWSVSVLERLRGLRKVKLIDKSPESEEPTTLSWVLEKLPPTIVELVLVASDMLKVWRGKNGRFDWKVRFPDLSRLSIKVNHEIRADNLAREFSTGLREVVTPEHEANLEIARSYKRSALMSQSLSILDYFKVLGEEHTVPFSMWLDDNLASFPMLSSFCCEQLLDNATHYLHLLPTTLESITLVVMTVEGVSWLSRFPLLHSLKIICKGAWILLEDETVVEKRTSTLVKDLNLMVPHFSTGGRPSTSSDILAFYTNFRLVENLGVAANFSPAELRQLFPELKSMNLLASAVPFSPAPMSGLTHLRELRIHQPMIDMDQLTQFVVGLPLQLVVLCLYADLTPYLAGCLPRTIVDLEFRALDGTWRELQPNLPPNLTKLVILNLDPQQVMDDVGLLEDTSIKVLAARTLICRSSGGNYGSLADAFVNNDLDLLNSCLHYSTLDDICEHIRNTGRLWKEKIKTETFLKFSELFDEEKSSPVPNEVIKSFTEDMKQKEGLPSHFLPILNWLQRRWQFFKPSKNSDRALGLAYVLVDLLDVDILLFLLPLLSPIEWELILDDGDITIGQDKLIPALQWLLDHGYTYEQYTEPYNRKCSTVSSAFELFQMDAVIWIRDHTTDSKNIFDMDHAMKAILDPIVDIERPFAMTTLFALAKHTSNDFIALLSDLRRNHNEKFVWATEGELVNSKNLMFCFLDCCPVYSPFALPLLDVLIDDFGMDPVDTIARGRRTRLSRKSLRDFFIPSSLSYAIPSELQMTYVEWMIKRGLSLKPRNLKLRNGHKFSLSLAHFAANQSNVPLLLLLHQHGADLDLPGGHQNMTPREILPPHLRSSLPPRASTST